MNGGDNIIVKNNIIFYRIDNSLTACLYDFQKTV